MRGVSRRRLIVLGLTAAAEAGCVSPVADVVVEPPVDATRTPAVPSSLPSGPAWASSWGTLRVSDDADALVVSSADLLQQTHDDWADAARSAAVIVRGADLGAAQVRGADGWRGRLVVGVPGTAEAFAAASGLDAQLARRTAAATLAPEGERPRTVGNVLATGGLDALGLVTLLVHEGVHQAMASPRLLAPRWLVEGVAVALAEDRDPALAATNRGLLAHAPAGTPTATELDGPNAAAAYAASSVAVRGCERAWGRPAVMEWLARWQAGHPGPHELDAAYRAELGRRA